ncbi:S8 family serine peptidase, partial [Streptacidiphilus melanogenes]|uniref:S8 family serine peptidase n=1 Tax=Streptacidiphilus melanogenes TaxID=411235 RepID=UPI000A04AE0A
MRSRIQSALLAGAFLGLIASINQSTTSLADQVRDAEWPLFAFHASSSVWTKSTGNKVVVAVIDEGVRASHQDLSAAVLPGKCFYSACSASVDTSGDGHGTAMASLIAGRGHGADSTEGVMGLAPSARILPMDAELSSTVSGSEQIANAVRYATDSGARIIDMSFGSGAGSDVLKAAIAYAESHDVVLVASAGNDGAAKLSWPAAYPGVVSVGAVDAEGKPWVDSNYGPGLTLAAPGVNIVAAGANSDSEYRLSDGTSDAAAYVSAEAALVRAEYPGLTAGQVVNRMVKSALNPTGRVHDDHYGYGIIRPDAALTFDIPAGPPEGPLKQVSGAGGAVGTPEAVAAGPVGGERQGGVGVGVVGAVGGVAA